MLPVEDALNIVLENVTPLAAEEVPLRNAAGRVLAEHVLADTDVPPFDRSTMDGYAVVAADTDSGVAELQVIEAIYAGDVPSKTLQPGQAAKSGEAREPSPRGCEARRQNVAGRAGGANGTADHGTNPVRSREPSRVTSRPDL